MKKIVMSLFLFAAFGRCPSVYAIQSQQQALAQDTSTATLSETLAWLRKYLIDYGASNEDNQMMDGQPGWSIRHKYDALIQDPKQTCWIVLSGSDNSFLKLDPSFDSLAGKIAARRTTQWTSSIPLFFLKSVSASNDQVTLLFDGSKGSWTEYGSYEPDLLFESNPNYGKSYDINVERSVSTFTIAFNQDHSVDNADIASRVAKAFTHAANLCASSRSVNKEPF